MSPEITLMLLLLTKHLIFDWFLQPPYMWRNKGKLFHPAGYIHAGVNVCGTLIALWVFILLGDKIVIDAKLFLLVLLGEFVSHYIMDWSKMNLNAKMGWGPLTHPEFWFLTGFDQFVHLVYLVLIVHFLV